jgi:hypothetical protein
MFDDQTLHDLCVICADMQASFRAQQAEAHRILCAEMVARLRDSHLDFEHVAPTGSLEHPAFIDYARLSSLKGGVRAAEFYFYHRDGIVGGSVPRTPDRGYAAAFLALSDEATSLIADMRGFGDVAGPPGNDWIDARRFRLLSVAAPGFAFPVQELFTYSTVTQTNIWNGAPVSSQVRAASIVVNADIDVGITALARVQSSTPGVVIGFNMKLDGVTFFSETDTRSSPGDGSDIDVVTEFDTSGGGDVIGTQTITIVNASSAPQWLDGIVRLIPPAL